MTAEQTLTPAETPQEEPDRPDLEAMLPEEGRFTLTVDGREITGTVGRLKSREFLMLMRVLTHGLGASLSEYRLDLSDEDEMEAQLLAMLMLAVPNAIEEFGQFVLGICKPVDRADAAEFAREMANPDPDVLLDVLGLMVEQEKDDLVALVGKARAWLTRLQRTMRSQTPTG